MTEDELRKDFEDMLRSLGDDTLEREGYCYKNSYTQAEWKGYVAGRRHGK
jgi:hypothetical protein